MRGLAAIVVVGLVLTACGGDDGSGQAPPASASGPQVTARRDSGREAAAAIRVGATVITFAEAEDELDSVGHNRDYLAYIEPMLLSNGGAVFFGDGFDPSFARMTLTRLVQFTLVHDELVARGVSPSDDCTSMAADTLPGELTGGDDAAGRRLFGGFTPEYQAKLVKRRAELAALMALLAGVTCAQTVPSPSSPAPGQAADEGVRQQAQAIYRAWYQQRLATVPIAVDPSIGTFEPSVGGIVAPGLIDQSPASSPGPGASSSPGPADPGASEPPATVPSAS